MKVRNFNKMLISYTIAMVLFMSVIHLVWHNMLLIVQDSYLYWMLNYFYFMVYFVPAIAMVIVSKIIARHRVNRDLNFKNKLAIANFAVMAFYVLTVNISPFDTYMIIGAIPVFFYSYIAFKDAML